MDKQVRTLIIESTDILTFKTKKYIKKYRTKRRGTANEVKLFSTSYIVHKVVKTLIQGRL